MEYIIIMLLSLMFIYVTDTNSKIKVIHRKIYQEDEAGKQNTHKLLNQNIGQTIKIKIKEGYEEYGEPGIATINTVSDNEVKVLALDKNWVHVEVYGKQNSQKLIRVESISVIDAE